MAANVPARFKAANLSRFVQRGAQVERVEPAIAYWCYQWVLEQAVQSQLHQGDNESRNYLSTLMDKIESLQNQYPLDDAIQEREAGKLRVEEFGLKTFQRADNAMRANKATKQTADTLTAAATFLDVLHYWGEPSPELSEKIKWAKHHALRIVKAIKAGEDPTLTNPAPDPAPAPLDPSDPEVQDILNGDKRATVEDVPDESSKFHVGYTARPPAVSRSSGSTPAAGSLWPPRAPPAASEQKTSGAGYFPAIATSKVPDGRSSAPVSPVEPWQDSDAVKPDASLPPQSPDPPLQQYSSPPEPRSLSSLQNRPASTSQTFNTSDQQANQPSPSEQATHDPPGNNQGAHYYQQQVPPPGQASAHQMPFPPQSPYQQPPSAQSPYPQATASPAPHAPYQQPMSPPQPQYQQSISPPPPQPPYQQPISPPPQPPYQQPTSPPAQQQYQQPFSPTQQHPSQRAISSAQQQMHHHQSMSPPPPQALYQSGNQTQYPDTPNQGQYQEPAAPDQTQYQSPLPTHTQAPYAEARGHSQHYQQPPPPDPALYQPPPAAAPRQPASLPGPGQYKRDDEAIREGAKHAKYAASALVFDDVDTAVKELRRALTSLGGL